MWMMISSTCMASGIRNILWRNYVMRGLSVCSGAKYNFERYVNIESSFPAVKFHSVLHSQFQQTRGDMPITYQQTADQEIHNRVRRKHGAIINELKSLDFVEFYFFGETVGALGFSPLG